MVSTSEASSSSTGGITGKNVLNKFRRSLNMTTVDAVPPRMSSSKGSVGCLKDLATLEEDSDEEEHFSTSTEEESSVEEAEAGEDLIGNLPDECIALVFRRLNSVDLNRCALVCSRWYNIDAESRMHITLKANVDILPHIPTIMQRFQGLSKLVLKSDKQSLSVDDDGLALIGKMCRGLRKLKLKSCKQITDDGLDRFTRVRPELRKFSCCGCGFGVRGLNALLENCTLLEDLTVKRSIRASFDRNQESVVIKKGSLRRLCLKDQSASHLWGPLIAGSTQLETLILARNSGYWDRVLETALGEGKLADLAQVQCLLAFVYPAGAGQLRGLGAIAKCAKLEALVVVKANDCTDVGLIAVAEGCTELRRIHIEGWASGHITDVGLLAIVNQCKQLQELVLVGHSATVASLSMLAGVSLCLERLTLAASITVTDAEVACLAQGCPRLKRLCIKACDRVSDLGLIALANGCPSLQKLKIRKCHAVTMSSITFLHTHRPDMAIAVERRITSEEQALHDSPGGAESEQLWPHNRRRHGEGGSKHRFAKARHALSAGTTYVTSTLKRWVKGGSRHDSP
eukprot:jgi/Mesen1/7474/ME000039S06690